MNTKFSYNQAALATLCRKWKVKKLALFGSVLRDDFRPDSDVDILVDFDPDSHWDLFDFIDMQDELKSYFNREVDLVEFGGIRNPIKRRHISNNMQVVYEAD